MIPNEFETCRPVRKNDKALNTDEIHTMLSHLNHWFLGQDATPPRLVREFRFKNFLAAMIFANAVAKAADRHDHHPRMTIEWGRVQVEWWTHVIGGLHRNDWIMAAETDRIFDNLVRPEG